MKFFIAILTVVALAAAEHTDEEKEMWQAFKLEHGKLFLSKSKEKDRMNIFLQNAQEVKEHNEAFANGEATYERGIHQYSDLTEEDFLARFTGINKPVKTRTVDDVSEVVTLRGTPPASLNLTQEMGVDWKVRYQGGCGSCWAFATAAAIESAYFRKTGQVTDVSEQQMVDCVYGSYGGCDGGWMPLAMQFISVNGGLAWESDYPYTANAAECNTDISRSVFLNATKYYSRVGNDDDSIKNALNDFGALAVCIDPTGWSSYKSGIFSGGNTVDPKCSHAAALVGYGTDEATGIPFWIVRNSWGSRNWGEQGYMRSDARRDPVSGKPYGGVMVKHTTFPVLL